MGKGFTKCNRCDGVMIYEKIYYENEHFWRGNVFIVENISISDFGESSSSKIELREKQ